APGAKLLFEHAAEGIDGGVRCVLLSPETVDEVLPVADREPGHTVADPAAAAHADRPEFPPLAEGVPLPVARLSYSALESYKRCGYRFYLERVVKMRSGADLVVEEAPSDNGDQLTLAPRPVAPDELSPLVRGTI